VLTYVNAGHLKVKHVTCARKVADIKTVTF